MIINRDVEPLYGGHVWGFVIDQTVSDPFSNVTYVGANAGFRPMKMNDEGVLDVGDWAGQSILERIKPCVVYNGATKKKYLNRNDITKFEDGTTVSVELGDDYMVEFPALGVKVTPSSTSSLTPNRIEVLFTDMPKEKAKELGFSYWNFQWGGTEEDAFYMAQFLAANPVVTGWHDRYISDPKRGPYQYSNSNNSIRIVPDADIAEGYDVACYNKYDYINALFVLFFKSTYGQAALAAGYTSGGSYVYTTYEANSKASTNFDNNYGMSGKPYTSRSQTFNERMSFLWLRDYWGNQYHELGGTYLNRDGLLLSDHQATYSLGSQNPDFTEFVDGGTSRGLDGGHVSKVRGHQKAIFLPTSISGGGKGTYFCDYIYLPVNAGINALYGGSNYEGNYDSGGLFKTSSHSVIGNIIGATGLRIQFSKFVPE